MSLTDKYEQRLKMVEFADRAGFWGYHLAEHTLRPLGGSPSPNVFLAAVAQRTQRLHLGPLVYILTAYHPVRLLQEICMLDHLSHGRSQMGFGRGTNQWEMEVYGVNPPEAQAVFDENLEVVLQGLRTGQIDHDGRYYHLHDVAFQIHPYQQPYPPIWYPSADPNTTAWQAANGLHNIVLETDLVKVRRIFTEYWRVFEEHSDDPNRLNPHVRTPKLGVAKHIYIGDTNAAAEHEAREAFKVFGDSFEYLRRLYGVERLSTLSDTDEAVAKGQLIFGTAETVRDRIKRLVEATGCNYVVPVFAFGTLSDQQGMRSIVEFSMHVIPAFQPVIA
jgi:alkanesulfonate monooxygenase SsuD/methylene tetrahydromethanopterin reductase-like flavin-dependent oxidoreductase (luciferase family)